jgi:hypothetical protein
VCASSGS